MMNVEANKLFACMQRVEKLEKYLQIAVYYGSIVTCIALTLSAYIALRLT